MDVNVRFGEVVKAAMFVIGVAADLFVSGGPRANDAGAMSSAHGVKSTFGDTRRCTAVGYDWKRGGLWGGVLLINPVGHWNLVRVESGQRGFEETLAK